MDTVFTYILHSLHIHTQNIKKLTYIFDLYYILRQYIFFYLYNTIDLLPIVSKPYSLNINQYVSILVYRPNSFKAVKYIWVGLSVYVCGCFYERRYKCEMWVRAWMIVISKNNLWMKKFVKNCLKDVGILWCFFNVK